MSRSNADSRGAAIPAGAPVTSDTPASRGADAIERRRRVATDLLRRGSGLLTRRQAIGLFLGLGAAATLAGPAAAFAEPQASQETLDKLANAQAQYDQVQAQLQQIANDYSALAVEQSKTLDKIESTQGQIDDTQADIDEREKELADKQDVLAQRMSTDYKSGGTDFLSVILSSATFDELISNVFYMNKISESDRELIQEVRDAKQQLEERKADLEGQKADLEALNEQQSQQMGEMQAKQSEVATVLSGLSQDVQDLIAQRDAEIVAAQKAEEEERRRAEEARKAEEARQAAAAAAAAAASKGQSGGSANANYGSGTGQSVADASALQQAVVNACYRVPSPGGGLCAMWVSQVYSAAGLGYPGGNANDQYAAYCHSSNRADLKPGMMVAVSSHPHTVMGRIYGHVGIYIGDGKVMSNIGYIETSTIDYWISYYGQLVPVRWGFASSRLG